MAVVFVLLLAVLLPLAMLSGGWTGWVPITGATAAAGGWCAQSLGVDATVSGSLIRLRSRTLSVDPQCTGVALLAVYTALVLAYPVSWKLRLLGILAGVPVLIAVNVVRLAGVAWASELIAGKFFYVVHDYLFEFGMVFAVLLTWVVWLSFARRTV